ncbi:uncharacterized protein LOC124409113 [Diprion similis]|uniref:uncharacterized protein LOC124409113 n=1 Tax=Diprion similis TaxID=362088 RepID=UPI001EF94B50|nr:uncharacterized protein LOC124409113 [Diprion similis]
MTELISLRKKRHIIQDSIMILVRILDEWQDNEEEQDSDFLQALLGTLEKAFQRFTHVQDTLEEIDETKCSKRIALQLSYNKAVARAQKYLHETNKQVGAIVRSSTPIKYNLSSVALPTIALPKFDGSIKGWTSFHDVFTALMDKTEDLTPVQKLKYLRLSLTDTAACSIQSLESTDHNYEIALSILRNKYESPRWTLHRHWVILREFPHLQNDTPLNLNRLVDTIQQHLQDLQNLGAPVEHWDIPLVDLILSKINPSTAWQWELTLTHDTTPSYKHLLVFLEKWANCVEFSTVKEEPNQNQANRYQSEVSQQRKAERAQAQADAVSMTAPATASKPTLSVNECQKRVTNAAMCSNCLGYGHEKQECYSEVICRKCGKRHHTLLQPSGNTTQESTQPGTSVTEKKVDESKQQA